LHSGNLKLLSFDSCLLSFDFFLLLNHLLTFELGRSRCLGLGLRLSLGLSLICFLLLCGGGSLRWYLLLLLFILVLIILLVVSASDVSLLLLLSRSCCPLLLLLLTAIIASLTHVVLDGTLEGDTCDARGLLRPGWGADLFQVQVELDGIWVC